MSIPCGGSGDIVGHYPESVGNTPHYIGYIRALVAPPPVGNRCKVWRVGLGEYAVYANGRKDGGKTAVFKCHNAVDAEIIIAEAAYAFDVSDSTAEAVKNCRHVAMARQHFERLVKGLALMYYDGEAEP